MENLKQCPFCGGAAMVIYAPFDDTIYVCCETCTAMVGRFRKRVSSQRGIEHFVDKEKAIEAWNRRVNDDAER